MSCYTVAFTQAISVASDLLIVVPADDKNVILRGFVLGQSTELAEQSPSQAEQLGVTVVRNSIAGTGASSLTPQKVEAGLAAMAATVTGYSTAAGSGGDVFFKDAFNLQAGYQCWFDPDFAPLALQSDGNIIVRLDSAPADQVTFSFTAFMEEI